MTTIVVVGGTGQAGRAVVREAGARGHDVRVVSRRRPEDVAELGGAAHHAVDLLADDDAAVSAALTAAFDGADAVVDTSNGMTPGAQAVFTTGARRVAEAAGRAGVGRAVVLSIAAVDQSEYPYYRAHAEQERVYAAGPAPVTVVRATQFHGFLDLFFGRGSRLGAWSRLGLLPYPRGCRFQTIDLRDVARALVDAAEGEDPLGVGPATGPSGAPTATVGGPQVLDARAMADAWRRARGSRRLPAGVPLPGPLGDFLRAGRNLVPDAAAGTTTYDQWLAGR
ncbi:SDR family oxidoreductase [Isoptericola sp. NPDC056605]|uniref:SDR family oxidoreductase n=1 Tax=Isoptericola sp. NPDC056605 TaxID=3345876 RepID=UPI003694404C